jgi:excinuclease ABC subunit A
VVEVIAPQGPDTAWETCRKKYSNQSVVVTFALLKPEGLTWSAIADEFVRAGFSRAYVKKKRINLGEDKIPETEPEILLIQDRIKIEASEQSRFHEAALSAFRLGGGRMRLITEDGEEIARFSETLESPVNGKKFRSATPALFSFNSPIGACACCRGFGRVIGLDWKKIIPHPENTLAEGTIAPFQGAVYGESQKDLQRACKKKNIPMDVPWNKLSASHRKFIEDGDPTYETGEWESKWYGVRGFFRWLESSTYKMHVRMYLSRWRAYEECPQCHGKRFCEESLFWKWENKTLADLYAILSQGTQSATPTTQTKNFT